MNQEHDLQDYQALQRWNGGARPKAAGRTRRRPLPTKAEAGEEYYTLVQHRHPQELITEVNRLCQGGWRPLGGIRTFQGWTNGGSECIYYLQSLWDPQAWEAEPEEETSLGA